MDSTMMSKFVWYDWRNLGKYSRCYVSSSWDNQELFRLFLHALNF